jgi:hypothetical protein
MDKDLERETRNKFMYIENMINKLSDLMDRAEKLDKKENKTQESEAHKSEAHKELDAMLTWAFGKDYEKLLYTAQYEDLLKLTSKNIGSESIKIKVCNENDQLRVTSLLFQLTKIWLTY